MSTYRRAEHDGETARSRGEGPEGKAGPAVPASLALAALLAGAAGIAFAPIFVKISEVGPVATAFWRVLLALPILLAWMEIEGRRSGKPGRPSGLLELLVLFASGLFLGSTFALWHLSLGLTSVANSTLLVISRLSSWPWAPWPWAPGSSWGKGLARPFSLAWRWPWAAPRCSSPAVPRGSEGEKWQATG
jgi:hypothetical protein